MWKKSMKISAIGFATIVLLAGCGDKKKEETITTEHTVEVAVAPTISYQSVPITFDGAGPFQLVPIEDGISQALFYQARSGQINILNTVVGDPLGLGYLKLEKVYSFGEQYVIIISTGEQGNMCPATTYAFTFDTKSESVTGKADIEGCSESVDTLADGNKLTVKKDGKATIIVNAQFKQSK